MTEMSVREALQQAAARRKERAWQESWRRICDAMTSPEGLRSWLAAFDPGETVGRTGWLDDNPGIVWLRHAANLYLVTIKVGRTALYLPGGGMHVPYSAWFGRFVDYASQTKPDSIGAPISAAQALAALDRALTEQYCYVTPWSSSAQNAKPTHFYRRQESDGESPCWRLFPTYGTHPHAHLVVDTDAGPYTLASWFSHVREWLYTPEGFERRAVTTVRVTDRYGETLSQRWRYLFAPPPNLDPS